MRGITSRVDIIWTKGFFSNIVRRRVDVTANFVNNSAVYTDQLMIPQLSVNDSGTVYYCVVNITASFVITSYDAIVLSFAGKL